MKAAMTVHLDAVVRAGLARISADPSVVEEVREDLRAAATAADDVPRQVLACIAAADEHLHYGELMEARTLLTAAHGLLARQQRPVTLPKQATAPQLA